MMVPRYLWRCATVQWANVDLNRCQNSSPWRRQTRSATHLAVADACAAKLELCDLLKGKGVHVELRRGALDALVGHDQRDGAVGDAHLRGLSREHLVTGLALAAARLRQRVSGCTSAKGPRCAVHTGMRSRRWSYSASIEAPRPTQIVNTVPEGTYSLVNGATHPGLCRNALHFKAGPARRLGAGDDQLVRWGDSGDLQAHVRSTVSTVVHGRRDPHRRRHLAVEHSRTRQHLYGLT